MELLQMIAYGVVGFVAVVSIVLLIIALVIMIQVLRTVKRVSARLDETTASFSEILKYSLRKGGPAAASALWSIVLRTAKRKLRK